MQPAAVETDIREAEIQDANQIYDLLVDGFDKRYLPYTIFQPSQSVVYLKRLIEHGFERSGHLFSVRVLDGKLRGFYDAVMRQTEFFLNYIAVAQSERGNGIGGMLLTHFETKGTLCGCQQYVLDVFESNVRAYHWYLNQGYQVESASFQVRVSTADGLTRRGQPLLITADDFQRAVNEEQVQGFSKVDGVCGTGQITVGLIGGQVCKLLGYHEVDLVGAVASVCTRFQTDRPVLIVPSLPELPSAWPILDYEKALRLVKANS